MSEKELTKTVKEVDLFHSIMKSLRLTLKNSVFYPPDHPIFAYSINNFKTVLDKWLGEKGEINIGFSKNELFLDGNLLEEKNALSMEVANYLHMRGLISIVFQNGINLDELTQLFTLLRNDRASIKEKGGLNKYLSSDHVKIVEIDYKSLLESESTEVSEEEKTWQFLMGIAKDTKKGKLPESKTNFLKDFFADTDKSAKILNQVYQHSLEEATDEEALKNILDTVQKICVYFEERSPEDAKELKVKLMHLISQLHPDLINILFEQTVGGETNFDLVETITKDFSESYIAEFIEKLISKEDTFNENLLKVFDKLAPNAAKSDNMMTMVADRLFSSRIVNPETLSTLQMSIKEIFNRHPDSNFMQQLHKITVDSVVNRKIDTLIYVARLSPLINKFVQSVEEDQLKKEKIWLILNILWLENNAEEFGKFSQKILRILPELLTSKETDRIREIVEFFSEKTRPEQWHDQKMAREIQSTLKQITDDVTIKQLISTVPSADLKELRNIAYIFKKSERLSSKYLVETFLQEKNPELRYKIGLIFKVIKNGVAKEVVDRFSGVEPFAVHDLFLILKTCSPQKTYLVAKNLMTHDHPQIRYEALRVFTPRTRDDVNNVFAIYKKEKHDEVKKRTAIILLKTRNRSVIRELFQKTERHPFKRKFLIVLVELCGRLRTLESFDILKRLFITRPLIYTNFRDQLRTTAISSIARLRTKNAFSLVRLGLKDKSKRVREASRILLQLNK